MCNYINYILQRHCLVDSSTIVLIHEYQCTVYKNSVSAVHTKAERLQAQDPSNYVLIMAMTNISCVAFSVPLNLEQQGNSCVISTGF